MPTTSFPHDEEEEEEEAEGLLPLALPFAEPPLLAAGVPLLPPLLLLLLLLLLLDAGGGLGLLAEEEEEEEGWEEGPGVSGFFFWKKEKRDACFRPSASFLAEAEEAPERSTGGIFLVLLLDVGRREATVSRSKATKTGEAGK